jgi:hypothetical protein
VAQQAKLVFIPAALELGYFNNLILDCQKAEEVVPCVTAGSLEQSNSRIHLRGWCRFVTSERGGWVPSLEMQLVAEKSIVFLISSILRNRSLEGEERSERNEHV